jgi:hypothetical protein
MCCCFGPEDERAGKVVSGGDTQDSDDKDRVRLLGAHHPDDSGKKCLVLDLDETLVHSSFRAVPGADFVIPVQVCHHDVLNCMPKLMNPTNASFLQSSD